MSQINFYIDDQVRYIVVNIALFIIAKQHQKATPMSINSRMNNDILIQWNVIQF